MTYPKPPDVEPIYDDGEKDDVVNVPTWALLAITGAIFILGWAVGAYVSVY